MFPVLAAIAVPADVNVGSLVTNPQPWTGAWEETVIEGELVVGFDVEIRTSDQGSLRPSTGGAQRVAQVWLTTYVRKFGRSERTFWSTGTGSEFTWTRNHLVLQQAEDQNSGHRVLLDLTFDPKHSEWRGRLENAWFAGKVLLHRPFVPHLGYSIIGDWIWGDTRGSYACEHVTLGGDSALVIWSDYLTPVSSGHGSGSTPPPTPQWYGELNMDAEQKEIGENALFFMGDNWSGDVVLGNLNPKDDVFSGQSGHFGNGYSTGKFDPVSWHRTTPDCGP